MEPRKQPNALTETRALTYLNEFEARTVEGIAEQIIPGEGEDAGAVEAGVVYYIDRCLSGFSTNLQHIYRLGLRELETFCDRLYSVQFVNLTGEQQHEVLRLLLGSEVLEPGEGLQFGPEDQYVFDRYPETGVDYELLHRLFAVIREHTVEGYFCDPVYGGNRNTVGWRLVGFPGARWGYTSEQMKPGFDARILAVKTLSDLRTDFANGNLPPNEHFYARGGEC